MTATAAFLAVDTCWICGGRAFSRLHEARFDLSEYRRQDPELAAYSGSRVIIQRCTACDFAQPSALPALPRFFDRMYDQRWADDWIAHEHQAAYKDLIFADILRGLARRSAGGGRLLDIGAHAGRFLRLASAEGWEGEGLELNPKTAAFAARASGAVVHHGNVHMFSPDRSYDAVTLIDVLEHVPGPLDVLSRVRACLRSGGWVAIKVPNGPAQRLKEALRARLRPGYRATIADNLVHVNHFSASSLARALDRAGFHEVAVVAAAPELPEGSGSGWPRLAAFRVARSLPLGFTSPLAFNLQAYGRRD
jgi:SAM-dependent methyltransferase